MSANIHPTALVGADVRLSEGVFVGPYCILEGDIEIAKGTRLVSHVYIKGPVFIGENNTIQPFVSVGAPPQDLAYAGASGRVRIGRGNTLREGVTVHAPTAYADAGHSVDTVIGDNCLLMVNAHVAHNTVLHDHVILANNVLLAGICEVFDGVFLSGNVVVHQGCRIGQNVMVSGGSRVGRDIPPFMLLSSFYGMVSGLNLVGLRRAGFSVQERGDAKEILRIFMEHKALNPSKEAIEARFKGQASRMADITLAFLQGSKRGVAAFGSWNDEKGERGGDF